MSDELRDALLEAANAVDAPPPREDAVRRAFDRRARRRRVLLRAYAAAVVIVVFVPIGILISNRADKPTPGSGASAEPLIVCADSGAELTARVVGSLEVTARRDGVHFTVENAGDRDVSFSVEAGGHAVIPPGRHRAVQSDGSTWDIPPGPFTARCRAMDADRASNPFSLSVTDPEQLWIPYELLCRVTMASGEFDGPTAPTFAGDPVELAREILTDRDLLLPDDLIEAAGYPDSFDRAVRVRRRNEIVGHALFGPADGGWHVLVWRFCGDA